MKRNAFTLVEVIIVIAVVFILYLLFMPKLSHHPEPAKRVACGSHLKQIYTAMYLYSEENDGLFPLIDMKIGQLVGGDASSNNVKPFSEEISFSDIPETAGRSISQNLWLLVRSEFATPEIFTCPLSEDAGEKLNKRDFKDQTGGIGSEYFVDFPYEKTDMTISYSFVQPWSVFENGKEAKDLFWSVEIDPRLAIGADANNGRQPNYRSQTMPPIRTDLEKYVNSINHDNEGQNVIFGDGHVSFERSAYTGINKDNIYTAQPAEYTGEAGQTAGVLSVRPGNEFDSVLVPNREADLKNWDRTP